MRYFFFFQAEDGIRDGTVTGVQTCALPISVSCPPTALLATLDGAPAATGAPRRERPRTAGREHGAEQGAARASEGTGRAEHIESSAQDRVWGRQSGTVSYPSCLCPRASSAW